MQSRRRFLTGSVGAALALAASQQASAQAPAPQGGRKRMIVDAQVHLWKAESPDWPWVPGMKPQMPEPFTIEKLVSLMDEAGVDRAVIVPPSWPGDRNDYGVEAARRYPNRFAVMGRIPLQDPKSAALLPTWKQQPGMLARIMRDGEEMRDSCGEKGAIHVANRCSNELRRLSALRHSRHEQRYAASLRPSICRAQETHN